MSGVNVIEPAFELAQQLGSIDDLIKALKREGYFQVEAHLSGRHIRQELRALIRDNRPTR